MTGVDWQVRATSIHQIQGLVDSVAQNTSFSETERLELLNYLFQSI